MRRILICLAVAAIVSHATAGTLIPVTPPPGSVGTHATEINDSNVIAGAFITGNGVEHGFTGPLNGSYTAFDDGDGTEPTGLSNNGYITGYEPSDTCIYSSTCHEFVRAPDGTFGTVTKDGVPIVGASIGINRTKVLVGDYFVHNIATGYLGKRDHYKSDINLLAPHLSVIASGINDHGDIAGYFLESGKYSGFYLSGGAETIIDFPSNNLKSTYVGGVSNKGVLVGSWLDTSNNYHAYYYDSQSGVFTQIDVPESRSTIAKGINSQGLVALYDWDSAKSYIYCPKKRTCPGQGIPAHERTIHAPQPRNPTIRH